VSRQVYLTHSFSFSLTCSSGVSLLVVVHDPGLLCLSGVLSGLSGKSEWECEWHR
jgi:hypothetical protein